MTSLETEHPERKPTATREGRWWILGQTVLFLALVASLFHRRRVPRPVRAAGVVLTASGVAVAVAGYRELGSSHDAGVAPAPGSRLVTTGIYGRTRHPIYLGWMLGSAGVEVVAGSPFGVAAAAALVVFYDRRVRREEHHLVQRYGDGYRSYISDTARFVPRARRLTPAGR